MKKALKIAGIIIVGLVIFSLIMMKAIGISIIGLSMHDDISNKEGIAINGYDPVGYFTDSTATKGLSEFATEWNGVTWQFSSEEHLKMFQENPSAFAPQFGGHCAFAASTGFAVHGDPQCQQEEDHADPELDPHHLTVVDLL